MVLMDSLNVREVFAGNQFEEDSKISLHDVDLIQSHFILSFEYKVRPAEKGERPNIHSKNELRCYLNQF